MNNITKILILFCFITGILHSQTFQLGLRSESTWYQTTAFYTESVPLSHIFITVGLHEENISLLNDLTEEIRFGRTFSPDYMAGSDLTLALKSHIIKNPFYISIGINMHSNIGYNGNSWVAYVKNVYMFMFGIGLSLGNHVFVDVLKYVPISNPSLGESDSYDYINKIILKQPWKLNSLVAINFGFTLDIFHCK